MFALTSASLLGICIAAAVVCVIAVTALAFRKTPEGKAKRVIHTLPLVTSVLVAQALAIMSTGLIVNNQYGFYTSWADFAGDTAAPAPILTKGLVPPHQGRAEVLRVPRSDQVRDNQLLVWLPPQYNDPAYADYRFPLVMFLPGSPGQPADTFSQFLFSYYSTQEIAHHRIAPFVGVFASTTTNPPRDTECTNIRGGPQVLTWLGRKIPHFVARHLRVAPAGANWTVMGYSTGGFCAAKLMLTYPNLFGSAVNFGGYYTPLQDQTTGKLFGGSRAAYDQNSPLWLYQQNGLGNGRLLMVSSREDRETWPSTRTMIKATAGDPGASLLIFPSGGHNYQAYRVYLAAALDWSAQSWGLWGNGTPPRPSARRTMQDRPNSVAIGRQLTRLRPGVAHVNLVLMRTAKGPSAPLAMDAPMDLRIERRMTGGGPICSL